jgi:phosphopantetheine adenylyltransferase
MTIKILGGKQQEPEVEVVKVSAFPDNLREKAAKQYLYEAITKDADIPAEVDTRVYNIIDEMDLNPYIETVFVKPDSNSKFLLVTELTNLFFANGVTMFNKEYLSDIIM